MEEEEEEELMVMIRDLQHEINTFTTWKLYQNPFFKSQKHHHNHHHKPHSQPLSARKLAASLWDLNSYQSTMASQLNLAKTQIRELKSELDHERKLRKKLESMNKKLSKELKLLRKNSEAMERLCEELVNEISLEKSEIDQMKREIEEERKMMRMAEVLREERVQMKFAEAKVVFEEKLLELQNFKEVEVIKNSKNNKISNLGLVENGFGEMGSCQNSDLINNNNTTIVGQRRGSGSEAENPHIKRGIKGFVEFPRVVRAISSRGRQLGSKLECQKAQLRLLLRQKSPFRTNNNLIMG